MNILEKIKGINHPNIIELKDYGTWENRFFEVMEFAEGGSLAEKMPFYEDELTRQIIPEIINALQFIHSKGIIHRDLKPSNLFYRDSKQKDIVLGDFGISSIIEDSEVTSVITKSHRTPAYTAPEIFAGIVSKSGDCGMPSITYRGQDAVRSRMIWESKVARDERNPYRNEWNDLVDAIRDDKPYNETERGVKASLVTSMGRMSAHTGREITYEQILNCEHEMAPGLDALTMDSPAPLKAGPDGRYPVPQPGIVTNREY